MGVAASNGTGGTNRKSSKFKLLKSLLKTKAEIQLFYKKKSLDFPVKMVE